MEIHKYYSYFHKHILHYKQSFYIIYSKKAYIPLPQQKATLPHHNNNDTQFMTYTLSQHTKAHLSQNETSQLVLRVVTFRFVLGYIFRNH